MIEPSWWMVLAAVLFGNIAGFIVAIVLGMANSMEKDTDWVLANMQQENRP